MLLRLLATGVVDHSVASVTGLLELGIGATRPGVVACSVGTSGAVRAVVPQPTFDPEARLFCYALADDLWVISRAISNELDGIICTGVFNATLGAGTRRAIDRHDGDELDEDAFKGLAIAAAEHHTCARDHDRAVTDAEEQREHAPR